MTKKLLCILLCLLLECAAFSACSAGKTNNNNQSAPKIQTTAPIETDSSGLKLSFTKSDSLDPFESKTLNNQVLQTLVFESLFILDESFNAVPQLASGYAYESSTELNVMIPSGLKFSNGDSLDADDVIYSFNRAASSPHWRKSLSCFSYVQRLSDNTVSFHMNYENPFAHNLLTFAIASSKTTDDGYPIGSGRYVFEEGDGMTFLTPNENKEGFNPHIIKITLVNIPSEESIENAINIGNISFAFRDLSSGSKTKMQCAKKAVTLSNFVYLGINTKRVGLSNEHLRRAISLAVDRDTLVKSAYRGYGKSAVSLFFPGSAAAKQTASFAQSADTAAAQQEIEKSKAENMTFTLLTNKNEERLSAAMLIKQQLEAVGFKIKIIKTNTTLYRQFVKSGNYDLYIGEIKLTKDMSLRPFFNKNGVAATGIEPDECASRSAYNSFMRSKTELGRFMLTFTEEMPFVPLLYRQGMLCYSRSMRGDMQGYGDNCFANIEDWYFN
jgi:peptide/nickel transport system substrate-binding protein